MRQVLSRQSGASGNGVAKKKQVVRQAVSAEKEEQVRRRCGELLQQAVNASRKCAKRGDDDVSLHASVGADIEKELFEMHTGVTRDYKAAVRQLVYNLKANQNLRSRVISDDVSPSALCQMNSFDLATADRQKELETLQDKTTKQATLVDSSGIKTTAYVCPQCSCTDASYRVLAGRRDIGKSETWGSADNSNPGMLLTCEQCSHRWHRDIA
mmetsp:Transcript_43033/g.108904  ORF Transcript_43033/g.108904 Transcript_43033/m.108904 type:complete len:212 (-) Transcript_43033:320-955(-)|eukprot:jgi/Tetstr1/443773/TSEL_031761.t1